jgi:hypothetical protein
MPLTDVTIKNVKSSSKTIRLFDGGGLYLEVSPAGGKWWRFKYRFGGKEKRLALGVYPDISLKDARSRHQDARKQLAQGIDPSEAKKMVIASLSGKDSFETVAHEWIAFKSPGGPLPIEIRLSASSKKISSPTSELVRLVTSNRLNFWWCLNELIFDHQQRHVRHIPPVNKYSYTTFLPVE